jgi:acyl-CoA oxidase
MLMKYSQVSKNGEYSRRGNEKISYATMLMTRSLIPIAIFFGLSKASTIITRYSLVRKQFKDSNGN